MLLTVVFSQDVLKPELSPEIYYTFLKMIAIQNVSLFSSLQPSLFLFTEVRFFKNISILLILQNFIIIAILKISNFIYVFNANVLSCCNRKA